jgi:hypothetical protein
MYISSPSGQGVNSFLQFNELSPEKKLKLWEFRHEMMVEVFKKPEKLNFRGLKVFKIYCLFKFKYSINSSWSK